MDEHLSVEEALSREVIRKLKLAAEAETKDDREIICEELFCDITGTLDTHAQVCPRITMAGGEDSLRAVVGLWPVRDCASREMLLVQMVPGINVHQAASKHD